MKALKWNVSKINNGLNLTEITGERQGDVPGVVIDYNATCWANLLVLECCRYSQFSQCAGLTLTAQIPYQAWGWKGPGTPVPLFPSLSLSPSPMQCLDKQNNWSNWSLHTLTGTSSRNKMPFFPLVHNYPSCIQHNDCPHVGKIPSFSLLQDSCPLVIQLDVNLDTVVKRNGWANLCC